MKNLRLKKDADRRIKAGHLWIFSNDIDTQHTPLKHYTPGELVKIETAFGMPLAIGYINPHCLLCVRLLTLNTHETIDTAFFSKRITTSLEKRTTVFDNDPYYRAVFGEADRLPGLVIDRFNTTVVAQLNTAGMECLKSLVIEAIKLVFEPTTLILKCDSTERLNEGLPHYTEAVIGELSNPIVVKENNCVYEIDLLHAQKTGWFYDHRLNRALISNYCKNKTVLDVFSYCGAFSLPAATVAKSVTAIDRSETAITQLIKNTALNNLTNVQTICDDAVTALEKLIATGQKFEVIILDPPALIKRKKDLPAGEKHYQKLNALALQLLMPGGVLFSASCSMHLSQENLLNCVRRAALQAKKEISVIAQCSQGPDHPIHPAIPETHYLKGFIFIT